MSLTVDYPFVLGALELALAIRIRRTKDGSEKSKATSLPYVRFKESHT